MAAALNLILGAVLLTSASADPDVLQQLHSVPYAGSPSGSSALNAVRSGLISSAEASAVPADTGFDTSGLGDVTVTLESTVDVFKTVTNVIYNSIPITLTEFIKSTAVQPTLQVLFTPVDDNVFVATAPVTRTDSVIVTNTNTGHFYVTEVSTVTYTITHKAYDIRQKTAISTLQQTQVFRNTVVRTRINTEYDTQTVEYLVTNTVVVQPRSTVPFVETSKNPRSGLISDHQGYGQGQQGYGSQQSFGQQGQQGFGQSLVRGFQELVR